MNKISNVKVTGLHGFKENTVSVDFLPNKPMSFLIGWNGIGKSTCLRLLSAALGRGAALKLNEESLKILDSIKFDTLEISFTDGYELRLKKGISQGDLEKGWENEPYVKSKSCDYTYLLKNAKNIIVPNGVDRTDLKINLLSCDEYYKTKSLKFNFMQNHKIREKECKIFEYVISNPELTNKYIKINRDNGELEITAKYGKKEYKGLTTDILSQGEKNLLLLYYHLIFKIPNNLPADSIFVQLIDTPETNTHIDSMITFYDNLTYINEALGRNDNYQFIIATHSPAITYNHNELMREMRRTKNGS